VKQVRDILLSFGRKRFLISGASAKGDDDYFSLLCNSLSARQGVCANEGGSQGQSSDIAQEITPAATETMSEFPRTYRSPAKNLRRICSAE
jgi:hypothetical protein